MAILPPPRLLLRQVHLSLPPQAHLLRLRLHPRQSPQPLLSAKAMTLRPPRLRRQLIPLLRRQLPLRISRLLRLLPPKPAVVAVAVAVAAISTVEASTYLGVCSF